ncbi:hypothetical protein M5K25_013348 [Dendrobium thyrsiflorum]|uniref:Uncharacterized protein n=1 Tax=Dendrobium thyrsiflorum TaxID=117978 RepID=A0ABD0V0N7_DENTH
MSSSSALSPSPSLPLPPPPLPPIPPFVPFLSHPLPLPSTLLKPLHAIAIRSAATASTSLLISLHPRLVLSAAAASSASPSTSLFPYAIRLLLHPSFPIPPSSFSWNSLLRLLAFSPTLKPLTLSLFLLMLLHSSPPPTTAPSLSSSKHALTSSPYVSAPRFTHTSSSSASPPTHSSPTVSYTSTAPVVSFNSLASCLTICPTAPKFPGTS